jgi:hypothetical protein
MLIGCRKLCHRLKRDFFVSIRVFPRRRFVGHFAKSPSGKLTVHPPNIAERLSRFGLKLGQLSFRRRDSRAPMIAVSLPDFSHDGSMFPSQNSLGKETLSYDRVVKTLSVIKKFLKLHLSQKSSSSSGMAKKNRATSKADGTYCRFLITLYVIRKPWSCQSLEPSLSFKRTAARKRRPPKETAPRFLRLTRECATRSKRARLSISRVAPATQVRRFSSRFPGT